MAIIFEMKFSAHGKSAIASKTHIADIAQWITLAGFFI